MSRYENSPANIISQKFADAKRAWFDWYHEKTISAQPGYQLPVNVVPITGNTTIKLDVNRALQCIPSPTPIFSRMRYTSRFFFYPQRLCVRGLYGNNFDEFRKIEDYKIPTSVHSSLSTIKNRWAPTSFDSDSITINAKGSLMQRLGFPSFIQAKTSTGEVGIIPNSSISMPSANNLNFFDVDANQRCPNFNVSPIIAYYDICAHYLCNPYDTKIPFEIVSSYNIVNGDSPDWSVIPKDVYRTYVDLYDVRKWLLDVKGVVSDEDESSIPSIYSLFDYQFNLKFGNVTIPLLTPFIPTTYRDGIGNTPVGEVVSKLENLISTAGLWPAIYDEDANSVFFDSDSIDELVSVNTGDTIESLRIGQSLMHRLFRSIVRGRKYTDWADIQFGSKLKLSDHPIFVGSDSMWITFQDILNAAKSGEAQLGEAGSRGQGSSKGSKTIVFTAQEPGYLIEIAELVPEVVYTNSTPNWMSFSCMLDFPLPEYSGRAFQDLPVKRIQTTFNSAIDDVSIGKQPLYFDFMKKYNTCDSLFSTDVFASYLFKRELNLQDLDLGDVWQIVGSTYVASDIFNKNFINIGQGAQNFFIKTIYNMRAFQPIDKVLYKTRM